MQETNNLYESFFPPMAVGESVSRVQLAAGPEVAGEIFGVGETTMRMLVRRHGDFPAVRIGKRIVILIPETYEWFRARIGERIDTGVKE